MDDCQPLLVLYQMIFGDFGFEVEVACSPHEALNHLASHAAHVAILDYEMPEMNGCALAGLIKKHYPGMPVILYSGSMCIPQDAYRWVDAICPKSAPREHLLAMIEATLAQHDVSQGGKHLSEDRYGEEAADLHVPGLGPCEAYPREPRRDSTGIFNREFKMRFPA